MFKFFKSLFKRKKLTPDESAAIHQRAMQIMVRDWLVDRDAFEKELRDAELYWDIVDRYAVQEDGVGVVLDTMNLSIFERMEVFKRPLHHIGGTRYLVDRCRCQTCSSCLKLAKLVSVQEQHSCAAPIIVLSSQ